jgi:hypothetical protein
MYRLLILIIASLSLGACSVLPKEFSSAPYTNNSIETGEMFGVVVGMNRVAARKHLEISYRAVYTGSTPCFEAAKSHEFCNGADQTDHFLLKGILSNANILLNVTGGRVVLIRWYTHTKEIS